MNMCFCPVILSVRILFVVFENNNKPVVRILFVVFENNDKPVVRINMMYLCVWSHSSVHILISSAGPHLDSIYRMSAMLIPSNNACPNPNPGLQLRFENDSLTCKVI